MASGKGSITLYSPLSGIIVQINEKLEDDPSIVKKDCYGEGWILKVKPTKLSEDLEKLMKGASEEFSTWLKEEFERVQKVNEELKAKSG